MTSFVDWLLFVTGASVGALWTFFLVRMGWIR